jgi:dipeptidyl aminopeptidase/acylaminoacyl peptidase
MIWPFFLPDGRHFLYFSLSNDTAKSGIRIGSIDSRQTLPLVTGLGPAFYVPGYVLFTRQNTAFALPFDAGKLRATGEAIPITEGVGTLSNPGTALTVSQAGVLAYRHSSATDSKLVWYDHSGRRLGEVTEAGQYRQAALSPDGKRAVVERLDPATNTYDLWLLELSSGIMSRLTSDPADDTDPVWSPDSRQIAFSSLRKGNLDVYRRAIGASKDELVYSDSDRKVPEWWLKDGTILYTTATGKDYHLIAAEGGGRPKDIFHVDFTTDEPCVSPDGKWIAFNSLESGRWEVYAASFPGFTDKRQVSNNGGGQARWRADGKELYYMSLDSKMMALEVKAGAGLETGVPRVLFETRVRPYPLYDLYGVTPDGQKFLVAEVVKEAPTPINVILDWPALLPKHR